MLAVPVFKLSILGFFLAFNGGGLIKEGEDGSDVNSSILGRRLRARLLGFFFLGEGEVIGRSTVIGGGLVSISPIFKFWKESRPNEDPVNEDNGTSVTGDSGDELGDGSESEDESTVDTVVVGEESVESDAWVEVLSRC